MRKSLKTWIIFLTACVQRGLSNVKESYTMRSPSEMDALDFGMFALSQWAYGFDWFIFTYFNAT